MAPTRARHTPARRRASRAVAATLAVGTLLAAACDDDGPEGSAVGADPDEEGAGEALPSPIGTAFTEGDFDDIPVFRGATPIQGPSEQDGAVTASYETKTATPENALRFYEDNLPALGWEVADPVRETSEDVWRGDWLRDGRRLQVSALPFRGADDDPGPHTQFSLVLLEGTGDIPVGATVPE